MAQKQKKMKGGIIMTEGISPLDGKWKKSIEISTGRKASSKGCKTHADAPTVRRIQKALKPKRK